MDFVEIIDTLSCNDAISNIGIITNAFFALVSILISIFTVILTKKNAKKQIKESIMARKQQQEQFEKTLASQRKQYEDEKIHNELVERLHEQPYIVFHKAGGFCKESETMYSINLHFINKGRGSAYDIVPEVTCEEERYNGRIVMRRCEPIQDPIALVGEEFVTYWKIESETGKLDCLVCVPIKYSDTSGRKYIQKYFLTISDNGLVKITNYSNPELLEQ